jgi:hypothetical protein
VAQAIRPDYGLGSHVAPLGMVFSQAASLPPSNEAASSSSASTAAGTAIPRRVPLVYVPFRRRRSGPPQDVVTGFVPDDAKTRGRPVGVALDKTGALLIADDVGNPAPAHASRAVIEVFEPSRRRRHLCAGERNQHSPFCMPAGLRCCGSTPPISRHASQAL